VIAAVAAYYAARDYLKLNYLKRNELEKHLRLKKQAWVADRKRKRMFTALHLARHIKITAEEAVKLSFASPRIAVRVKKNPQGYAEALLFEYLLPGEKDEEPEETESSAYD
jgi:hypothetical protein